MIAGALAVSVTTGVFVVLAVLLLVAQRYIATYGTCNVSINGGAKVFEQPGGATLLGALNLQRIFIPSACGGRGSCGFCKVTVTKGGGPVLPTELPFLSRVDLRRGTRLACQVKVTQDLELLIPAEMLAVREFHARVVGVRELTHDIKEINLQLMDPAEIAHHPGQYVQVQAPGPEGAVYRAYSISSPAYEKNVVQLVVRVVPGGIASTYLHGLKSGDEVTFTGPYGDFRIADDPQQEVVLVGGGCGMAPLKNIVYTAYRRWPDRRIYLFFGARTARDTFYLDMFRELKSEHPNLEVVYALSDPLAPDEHWDGETGFIHLSVDKHLDNKDNRQAFLCGPPPMIEAVTEILKKKGVKGQNIFYDKF